MFGLARHTMGAKEGNRPGQGGDREESKSAIFKVESRTETGKVKKMKRARQPFKNFKTMQGPEARHARTRYGLKIAGILILFASILTLIGIYTVCLKFQIDYKHLQIDKYKSGNSRLEVQIRKLEADIDGLKCYERIERVLSDAGQKLAVSEETVYINLDARQARIIKAEGETPASRAGIF